MPNRIDDRSVFVVVAAILPLLLVSLLTAGTAHGTDLSMRLAQHTPGAASPVAGEHPIDSQGHMHIGEKDRYPVCAMKVKDHSKFASAIQLKNGITYNFSVPDV